MDGGWDQARKIELRDKIRLLTQQDAKDAAFALLNSKPGAWNAYIGVLEAKDLPNLSEVELFVLMRSLKTGSREAREHISEEVEQKGIDDIAAKEAEKISLYLDRVGYALLTDMEDYGNKDIRKTIFGHLHGDKHLFTIHPIPNYRGSDAANTILVRNSNNLHKDVKDYLNILIEEITKKKASQLDGLQIPKAITLQEATLVMMRYGGYDISMREGMIRAMVGLAYGGSPPLEKKLANGNPFTDLPLIEFTDTQWEKIPYPNPKSNTGYQGPFWVLNEQGEVGRQLANLKSIYFLKR